MTIPTLHVPLKDSPVALLITGINDTETTLVLSSVVDFEGAGVTRLTLGINEEETETVEVVEYVEDPSGGLTGEITVIRGSSPLSWASGTWISRVMTAADLSEIHEFLEDHNHAAGYGPQIPTEGLEDAAVTGPKIANETITNVKLANRTRKIFLPASFVYVSTTATLPDPDWPIAPTASFGVKLKDDEDTYIGINGLIPVDYLSDGALQPVVQTYLGGTSGLAAYLEYEVNIGKIGEQIDSKTLTEYTFAGAVAVSPFSSGAYNFINTTPLALPASGLESGDILTIDFKRRGTNVLDTFTSWLMFRGFIFTYTADS